MARLESLRKPCNTLTVDCGGGGIKSAILDRQGGVISKSIRTEVNYPFTPDDLREIIETQTAHHQLPFQRITVGMPGVIRQGVITYTPHYIRDGGPHTSINPRLAALWNGLNLARKFGAHFSVPCKVLNDAEVAAYAVIRGIGNELVLTLGTGLGCAFSSTASLLRTSNFLMPRSVLIKLLMKLSVKNHELFWVTRNGQPRYLPLYSLFGPYSAGISFISAGKYSADYG
ncbi:ROK family protein [Arcanobacterium hippocoleae]